MFRILTRIVRKAQFILTKKLRANYNKIEDDNYPMVIKLRSNGCYIAKDFAHNNIAANKIIHFFNEFKKTKEFADELNKINEQSRYKYRSKLTKFFDRNLLLQYAEDIFFIKNIQQYMGLAPKVRLIDVWLDKPVSEEFQKYSQLYHRDHDDFFMIKTFLCLTEIRESNGPLQYVQASHIDPWKNLRNQHTDSDVEEVLYPNKKIFSMTGSQGDMYAADTNGFHKGKTLTEGIRCLVSVQYVSENPRIPFKDDKFQF